METCRTTLSVAQCKDLLTEAAKMFCLEAALISERLLSPDDKKDMMNGDLPIESFLMHVKIWAKNGCFDMVKPKYGLYIKRYSL
jgi:hypothetical protein